MTKDSDFQAIREAVTEALRQGECLLEALPKNIYTYRVPSAFNATIGEHYRHCLEHFESLLKIGIYEEVNYDIRDRNAVLETDPECALQRTRMLMDEFSQFCDESWFRRTVPVRCKVSYHGDTSPAVPATLAREGMYVVVHAIHHFALISVMCSLLDVEIPAGFGVAPSTAHHERKKAGKNASVRSESSQ